MPALSSRARIITESFHTWQRAGGGRGEEDLLLQLEYEVHLEHLLLVQVPQDHVERGHVGARQDVVLGELRHRHVGVLHRRQLHVGVARLRGGRGARRQHARPGERLRGGREEPSRRGTGHHRRHVDVGGVVARRVGVVVDVVVVVAVLLQSAVVVAADRLFHNASSLAFLSLLDFTS